MIVRLQNPVKFKRQANENQIQHRNFINSTNPNCDHYTFTKVSDNIKFLGLEKGIIKNIKKLEKISKHNKSLTNVFFDKQITSNEIKKLTNNLGVKFKQIISNNDINSAEEFIDRLVKNPNACIEICSKNLFNDNFSYQSVFSNLLNKSITENARIIRTREELKSIPKRKLLLLSIEEIETILRWEKLSAKVLLSTNKAKPEVAEKMVMENLDNFSQLVKREMFTTINAIKKVLNKKPDKYTELLEYTNPVKEFNKISAIQLAGNKGIETIKLLMDDVPLKAYLNIARDSNTLEFGINFTKYLKNKTTEFGVDSTRLVRGIDYTTKMSARTRDRIISKTLYNSFKADKNSAEPFSQWNNLNKHDQNYIKSIVENLLTGKHVCKTRKAKLKSIIPFELSKS